MNELLDRVSAITKQRLSLHLCANAIGDYYDIQPLCRLARVKVKREFEERWHSENFAHLLRETCQTRKTGDVEFHRLLGLIATEHLEDVAWLQELSMEDLDMPPAVTMSFFGSSISRVRHLERKIRNQASEISVLKQKLNIARNAL